MVVVSKRALEGLVKEVAVRLMHSFLISISIGLVEERKASPYLQEPFYPEVVPV